MHGLVLLDVVAHRHANDDTDDGQDDEEQDEAPPGKKLRSAATASGGKGRKRPAGTDLDVKSKDSRKKTKARN